MIRIVRASLPLLSFASLLATSPDTLAGISNEQRYDFNLRGDASSDFLNFNSSFFLSDAPAWLMNALPGSPLSYARAPYLYDRDGDRTESVYRYATDVGTVTNSFKVMLFNNVTISASSGGTSKSSTPLIADVTGGVLFWDADAASTTATGGTGNWLGGSTWRLTTSTGTLQAWDNGNTANLGGTAGTVTVNGNVSATNLVFTVPGYSISGANNITLTSTGTASGSQAIQTTGSAGTTSVSAPIILGAAAGSTQTFSVGANTTLNISSAISEANAGVKLSKTAAGTLILGGTNTYTGSTSVSSGTLVVNGSTSSSSAVSVSSATLGGTGTVGGSTTLNAGGTITGATNGTVGSLTLSNNLTFGGTSSNLSTYVVDLTAATSDLLAIRGTLNLSSAFDQITFQGTAGALNYTLATYSALTNPLDTFNTVMNLPSGYTLVYGPTELDLIMTAVPEPSTWIGAALTVVAIGITQRKRIIQKLKV
ncbi:MAG TPA: autotransporter-associated beta strand repeat-containing protein [Chthoniobacterales bacterium]